MQTTMSLPRFSNCLPLEWNVHMMIKNSFHGLWHGLKGKGKERDKCFGNIELKAMKTMKQALINQHENEHYKHSTPNQKQSPQWIGNELTMHIIHSHSFSLFLLCLRNFPSFLLFVFFFFFANYIKRQKSNKRHNIVICQLIT